MFGYEDHELPNRPDSWQKIIHPDDLPGVLEQFEAHVRTKGQTPFNTEVRYYHKNGSIVWVVCRGKVIEWDDDGNPLRMVGSHVDVTAQKEAEHAINASEERFRLAAEGMRSGIWDWIDVNENKEWWSPRFYELLGYEKNEMEATFSNFKTLLHADDHERTLAKVKACFENDRQFDIDYRLRQKSGDYRWFNGRAALQRDAQGNPSRMVGSITDIDERIKAQSERDAFFDMSSDMLCVAGFDGYFKLVNAAAEQIFGYSPEELLELHFDDLTHPDDIEKSHAEMTKLATGATTLHFENRNRRKDGKYIWISWCTRPDPEKQVCYCVGRDITFYKETEAKLRKHALELERQNKELEQFAYIASHDLQEPLRKIQAFADRLILKHGNNLDNKGAEYLERIQNAAHRMQRLIEALLQLSRIKSPVKPFAAIDLNEVVTNVIASLEPGIEASGAIITVQNLSSIKGNPVQIRQLLQNLISNALKFSQKHESPKIKISGEHHQDPKQGPVFRLVVEDNGIGFDEKYLDRIFLPFQRLHDQKTYPGTGMGTAIIKKVVECHGGNISAQSSPGKGARFIITLPTRYTSKNHAEKR